MVATTTTNKTAAAPITEATTTTSATPAAPIAEATNKAGDQLVSVVKQGQKVALDVAEALAKLTPPSRPPYCSRSRTLRNCCPIFRPSRPPDSTWPSNC